jgi:aspartate aminotransferase
MSEQITLAKSNRVSSMASGLQGSEIIRLAGEINARIKAGKKIYNFTIGDYDPNLFPLSPSYKELIQTAYKNNETNYPAANGIASLREAAADLIKRKLKLAYSPDEFLIASGARPLIYAAYLSIVNEGENVVFPVPSWNNNHYSFLSHANAVLVESKPENNFMPTASDLEPLLQNASLLALCSPLNPTGTVFSKESLYEIGNLVLAENLRRGPNEKPLYILYDQIYWMMTHGETKHVDPVSLIPELRPYTIYVDGVSKAFAATGVRVGWAFGPDDIIEKMRSILGHVGAWAPKAEQVATAAYLNNIEQVDVDTDLLNKQIQQRLVGLFNGIIGLKKEGLPIDAVAPQAAIYLTVKIDLKGKRSPSGELLSTSSDITKYLLDDAGIAIVPFYAFGASKDSCWFRLSVGTLIIEEIDQVIGKIKVSLEKLQ